jgi:CheY-like chemotaxis protein
MSKKILIVDDDEIFRLTASITLKRAFPDSEVLFAKHGEEALDVIDNTMPSLILLDLNMPIMDGWEFLEATNLIELAPIYIMSSSIDPRDKQKALNNPKVKGFIEKPLDESKITVFKNL